MYVSNIRDRSQDESDKVRIQSGRIVYYYQAVCVRIMKCLKEERR